MMAAQAAVLSATSATSATDVNLVKRAPTSDDEVEQSDMASQSSSAPTPQHPLTEYEKKQLNRLCAMMDHEKNELIHPIFDKDDEVEALKRFIENLKERRKRKTSDDHTRINAALAEFEKDLAELDNQLSEMKACYELKTDIYLDIKHAVHDNKFGYLREKYLNPQ
ncbi:hypothetical protein BASA61_002311 [Batrachochytrium salamandrivorans]|nr:hypothetical protein BASA60_005223 [Batrachochytrium salamandrivorans]KAH6600308.1 hypothetical protein BASA61_002311 [Batrachochytrium salamandrivorans]KAH9266264.1 hypothetical protein BASA83_010742 [Batrachochytrium salamandrivorans]